MSAKAAGAIQTGPQGAVDQLFQPVANRLLGEGVDDQRDSRRCIGTLGGVPDRQQAGQERDGQLVQLQGQRDQARIDERRTDDDPEAEQVRGEDGVAHGRKEQDRRERADVDEPEVAEPIGKKDVGRDAD